MIPVEVTHRLRGKKNLLSSGVRSWSDEHRKASGLKFWVILALFWGVWFFLGYVVYPLLFNDYPPLRYLSLPF